jgi:Fe-S-cluster containining protein
MIASKETTEVCKRCKGFCCRYHMARPRKTNKEMVLYWSHRASPDFEPIDDGDHIIFVVPQPCPQYKYGKCQVYKDRSSVCRNFPPAEFLDSKSWGYHCEIIRRIEDFVEIQQPVKAPKQVMKILS